MKTLELTQVYVAQVSDEDFDRVKAYKWHAAIYKNPYGTIKVVYGQRNVRKLDGKKVSQLLHRFVLGVNETSIQVDHKDRNGLNCQRGNLRKATPSQNSQNRA